MRQLTLLVFTFTIYFLGHGQLESWTYCFNEVDSIFMSKTNELQSGDSTFKTFSEDYTNSDIELLYLNDTMYSKYNGNYYFLGTDNPSIGDVWNPLRYHFMSFQDSSTACPNLMSVEVVAVNRVPFGNDSLNLIDLIDLDLDTSWGPVNYQYLETVGGTVGGPLYNLTQQMMCDVLFDFTEPTFRNFTRNAAIHEGQYPCPPLSVSELDLENKKIIKILDVLGRETPPKKNELQIYIYEGGTSRRVFQTD